MQLGVIGLGTMGANLARNAARAGAKVAVYNRTTETMEEFMQEFGDEGDFVACRSLEELRDALIPPRPILLMVKAGKAVDAVNESLEPLLDKGDIIIDAGNSHYPDSARRTKELHEKGLKFVGMGVSGGEEGALMGPSMMPGGDQDAWQTLRPLFTHMAADDGEGGKCVSFIGSEGAGHFVKMVHNGIEYGIMQLIAESYDLLKHEGQLNNADLADVFAQWNKGEDLQSFLVEITAEIFKQSDAETDNDLIDMIADRAGQKGTGKWTTEAAMDLGIAIPTINAAVDARIISGTVGHRSRTANVLPTELSQDIAEPSHIAEKVRSALELSVICAYTQGFELMKQASDEWGWNLDLAEIARIWRGGCIIRSAFLTKLQKAYTDNTSEHILERFTGQRQHDWRDTVALGVKRGISVPALNASLSYYDALRRERLPQNLIQAQRDFFGAHTYERTDKEGKFHTEWGE